MIGGKLGVKHNITQIPLFYLLRLLSTIRQLPRHSRLGELSHRAYIWRSPNRPPGVINRC